MSATVKCLDVAQLLEQARADLQILARYESGLRELLAAPGLASQVTGQEVVFAELTKAQSNMRLVVQLLELEAARLVHHVRSGRAARA